MLKWPEGYEDLHWKSHILSKLMVGHSKYKTIFKNFNFVKHISYHNFFKVFRLIGKDPDAGKDWGQEEKGAIEDEMVGWHHWFNAQEFQQTPGDSEGQGILVYCSPWDCKESDTT